MRSSDIAIIGGGIIGLATAYQLTRLHPGKKIVVLEKEKTLAVHQTGHNSGVLHSGIYYRPGSLKAINCREGKLAMERFCTEHGIDYDICGKVIVATEEKELPALDMIYERGQANEVKCEVIGPERMRELEPHARGIKAIYVPETGIVDYQQVCERMAQQITGHGAEIVKAAKVQSMQVSSGAVILETTAGTFQSTYVVNCAGLYSDKVTAMSQKPEVRIVPFRGEFYKLEPEAHHLCRNLIYPVPDPAFPFLGVHFTRMIDGSVECGPNAVLALAREGYRKTDIHLPELLQTLTYPAFWKIALRYWRVGAGEMWRSLSKRAFVRALQRLVPEIRLEHLQTAPAGIRAQALAPDGQLVDDFFIQETEHVVNVCNAPSPAATASLNIGRLVTEKLAARWA